MSLTNSANWMYSSGAKLFDHEIGQASRWQGDTSNAPYFRRNLSINRQKWTCSFWIKRSDTDRTHRIMESLDNQSSSGNYMGFLFFNDGRFHVFDYSSGYRIRLTTSARFKDIGAWYHVVLRFDSTQSTSSNRVRLYINGEQISFVDNLIYPSQNLSGQFGNGTSHYWGRYPLNQSSIIHGYMADVILADGQSYGPEEFGETKSDIWIPKNPSITYGSGGFRIDFSNSSSMGTDVSGNSNNWTAYNWGTHDQVLDTPTNNFCTMNSAHGRFHGNYTGTFKEGNLFWEASGNASHAFATFPIVPQDDNGYYFEVVMDTMDIHRTYIGFVDTQDGPSTGDGASYEFNTKGLYSRNGYWYGDSGLNNGRQYTAWVVGDVIMVAYKQGKVWFGKNGTWFNSGNPAAGTGDIVTSIGDTLASKWGTNKTWIPYVGYNSGFKLNFGADSSFSGSKTRQGNSDENGYGDFYYTPPSGFLAMCSANLPADIDNADDDSAQDYFNTVLWTGNGGTQSISGLGFEPDFVWLKGRSYAEHHQLYDTIRGATEVLYSNRTNAEQSDTLGLTSFDSDGFSIGSRHEINNSGDSFVGWAWDAGGSGVTNTSGSVTSTVSANPTAGFSIVTYTGNGTAGATVGHGLGKAPSVIICKRLDLSDNWIVYHQGIASDAATDYLHLDLSNAAADNVGAWNDTAPSSTVFTLGSFYNANAPGGSIVAYCFADVAGYQKAGSYRGNGSTNGAFVYTGFRPAFVMIKRTDSGNNWFILDNKRSPNNLANEQLLPNSTSSESTNSDCNIDILSNGFKLRTALDASNASGGVYLYLAIAEQPLKYANAR